MREFKRLCAVVIAVSGSCLLSATERAHSQTVAPVAPVNPQGTATASPSPSSEATALYTVASSRLERGRAYLLAIADLKQAVKLEPEQSKYYVALGCAYAGRASVIADVAYRVVRHTKDIQKYERLLKEWEDAQHNNVSPLFGVSRPLPPVIVTKDDQLPYKLNADDAAKQFHGLASSAFVAWNTSILKATDSSDKSVAVYTRAWGRLLFSHLQLLLNNYKLANIQEDDVKLFDRQQAEDEFTSLAKASPKEAKYWQAIGDSIIDKLNFRRDAVACKSATQFYLKALDLNKGNANLWYRVYKLSRNLTPDVAEQALKQASSLDPGNAFASYGMADILLGKTYYSEFYKSMSKSNKEYLNRIKEDVANGEITQADITSDYVKRKLPAVERETDAEIVQRLLTMSDSAKNDALALTAMEYIEAGNHAGILESPVYIPPMPHLLLRAWFLQPAYLEELLTPSLVPMFASCNGYVQVALSQHKEPQAIRMLKAMIAHEYRMAGPLDLHRLPQSLSESAQTGRAIIGVVETLVKLQKVYEVSGDNENNDKVKSELVSLQRSWQIFEDARVKADKYTYTSD